MDINGEASGNYPGNVLSLAVDGKTVAIGATGNDNNGNKLGLVRVFNIVY